MSRYRYAFGAEDEAAFGRMSDAIFEAGYKGYEYSSVDEPDDGDDPTEGEGYCANH